MRLRVTAAATLALALGAVGVSATAQAGAAHHSSAAWTVVDALGGAQGVEFSSVSSLSGTQAWAFARGDGTLMDPTAWRLSGTSWTQFASPGLPSETIVASGASAATNVWVATSSGRVLHWNGSRWKGSAKFSRTVSSVLVLGTNDVWVFGTPYYPGPNLGAWHYNGATWRRSGSLDLTDGSALSPSNIWAVGETTVDHLVNGSWKAQSVSALLPKDSLLCRSYVSGILAASPSNVWATGSGGCQDFQGPFVLLHYDGTRWRRTILDNALGAPAALVSDGGTGMWIVVDTGSPSVTTMEHFIGGRLVAVPLPYRAAHVRLVGVAIGPRGTAAFAAGSECPGSCASLAALKGIVLRYRP